jgi:nucleotide-binding universal stress UspA family protein
MLTGIAHTTDFSPQSAVAFLHALRLSLDARSRLDLLHVRDHAEDDSWQSFPHVREVLVRWGLLDAQASPADIVYEGMKLDLRVLEVDPIHRRIVLAVVGIPEEQPPRPDTVDTKEYG